MRFEREYEREASRFDSYLTASVPSNPDTSPRRGRVHPIVRYLRHRL